jgi:hypothetical protein
MPPPTFAGKKDDDVSVWLDGMDSYLTLCEESLPLWVPVAETYLEGSAREQWRLSKPAGLVTWATFGTFLTERFGNLHSYQDTRRQLAVLKVAEPVCSDTVTNAARAHARLTAKAGTQCGTAYTDQQLYDSWTAVLERSGPRCSAIARDVEATRNLGGAFATALTLVGDVYRFTASKAGAREAAPPVPARLTAPVRPQPQRAPLEGRVQKVQDARRPQDPRRPQPQQQRGLPPPPPRAWKDEKEIEPSSWRARQEERRCGWCGKPGHLIRLCRREQPVRTDAELGL